MSVTTLFLERNRCPGVLEVKPPPVSSSHHHFLTQANIDAICDATALSGVMCTLAPANPVALAEGEMANLTATINIPNNAVPGTYNIKINTQDTTGTPSHSAMVSLTLAPNFHLTSSTPSQTVTAGQTSGRYALSILPVGSSFTGAVTLACTTGLPTGAKCSFNQRR